MQHMVFEPWQIWLILAILLLIVEIFTITFLTASLAIGSLAAGVFSYLGFDINYQLIVFSIGSTIAFFGARPFMKKYAYKHGRNVKTNMEALEGQIGRVVEDIDPNTGSGRVIVGGDDWKAESLNDIIIIKGNRIRVIQVKSTTLIVDSLEKP